jgi:hypothetical protein
MISKTGFFISLVDEHLSSRHIWRTELFKDRSDQDENMETSKKISSVF